ncbi:MAG: S41 family peptidase [Saprospiraceae bacterium]|nr:S41 family peptidase [Saprospiraceae bacterium]
MQLSKTHFISVENKKKNKTTSDYKLLKNNYFKSQQSLFIILKFIIILTPSVFSSSCSHLLLKADVKNTPRHCFKEMWQTVNDNYAFFEYKNINWNAVYDKYAPSVSDSMSQDSLYSVLSAMLYELKDGHVNLSKGTDRSRNWSWKDDFPDNFNPLFTQRQYLKRDFQITNALKNQILEDSIGYIRYESFGQGVSDADLDYVLKRMQNTKGLIIDVRDNGGGSMATIFRIMARFVDKRIHVGNMQTKNGRIHNEFTNPTPLFVEPKKDKIKYLKPIVVLINRGCYSATTHFAAFMSLLPNVTIVGDRAGGGGGLPISRDLPNGWQYRFSATMQTLPDGSQIESGFDPDIQISTGPKEELEGKDAIIEGAIEVIKKEAAKSKV